jgi:hypothetical protein
MTGTRDWLRGQVLAVPTPFDADLAVDEVGGVSRPPAAAPSGPLLAELRELLAAVGAPTG